MATKQNYTLSGTQQNFRNLSTQRSYHLDNLHSWDKLPTAHSRPKILTSRITRRNFQDKLMQIKNRNFCSEISTFRGLTLQGCEIKIRDHFGRLQLVPAHHLTPHLRIQEQLFILQTFALKSLKFGIKKLFFGTIGLGKNWGAF